MTKLEYAYKMWCYKQDYDFYTLLLRENLAFKKRNPENTMVDETIRLIQEKLLTI